jgi:hypothetical protein
MPNALASATAELHDTLVAVNEANAARDKDAFFAAKTRAAELGVHVMPGAFIRRTNIDPSLIAELDADYLPESEVRDIVKEINYDQMMKR